MKKLSYLTISLCLVLLVYCATEQKTTLPTAISQEKCDTPVWNAGDYWRFRYSNMKEWQYTVEKVEEDVYIINDLYAVDKVCFDKKNFDYVAYINRKGERVRPTTPSIFIADFPLHIGKKWKKMISAKPTGDIEINYLNEYKVLTYEDVTVPAGTFGSFKIQLNQTNFGGKFTSGKAYIWYSPAVKFITKVEFEDIAFWRLTKNWALIKFELKDKQPSPPEKKLPAQEGDTKPQVPQVTLPEKPLILKPATPPPATNIVVVTGTSANIRSGAGNDFSIVAIVKQGDKLTFLGEYGEWFNVRLENGQEGWINNMFVK